MTTKKLGKIMVLATIPHFFGWAITAGIVAPNPDHLPVWVWIWLGAVALILTVGGYMADESTPKDTWKAIVKFINE